MAEGKVADPFQLCGVTIDDKYRIASVVGDGGFGVVYRGVHKGFGELIAVKCLKLPPTFAEKERDELLEQLREEGRLLHRLSRASSSIVQALDVGAFTTPAGTWVPYLVLEWLEGQTLGDLLRDRAAKGEGGMTLTEAIRLLDPAARALGVAHAQKIAHRDVKPANLFVTDVGGQNTLKVLDFGIAKVLSDHASFTQALAATAKGPSAFTPRYGAPEQFNKQRGATGPWTDVFALALILVELVSGRKALDGDDPTQLYIASADPAERPTLRARGVEVPDAVEKVLARALAVEAKNRFPDAAQFWDALTKASAASAESTTAKGRAKPAADAPPDMATADYAVEKKLNVVTEGGRATEDSGDAETARAKGQEGVSPTVPVESLRKPGTSAKVIASAAGASAAADRTAKSARAPEPKDDPMAETPVPERKSKAASKSAPPAEASASAEKALVADFTAGERPKRSVWPWVGAVVLVGGVGFAYATWAGTDPPPRPPKATPSSTAKTTPSAPSASPPPPASASGSPSASAVSSAAVPPPTPADMVYIAPATFRMGEGEGVEVTITHGYFIEAHEVTVRAYQECMQKKACEGADRVAVMPDTPGIDGGPPLPAKDEFSETWSRRCNEPRGAADHPINCVDWPKASAYCAFRGRRLPTEAEWELAARGVTGRRYAWGPDEPDCARACVDRNASCLVRGEPVATCTAGSHAADRTPDGIYDLGGNVAEWVSDGFGATPASGSDPKGDPKSLLKSLRGGSFFGPVGDLRASFRNAAPPSTAHVTIGFRCAADAG